ncbi:arabinan endo-1,5-alpha-L-arabinosidase [Massilia psychrophila]|uniref:Extracellular exo-alpha-(1->5)-L-arabinofuranosidase n=1 Tax=Massilia psychrophila TaxID=1603353 RepID=A0A2G8T2R1_9BURK|nr:arabinan endo-1,5-alpha-L-arabinosidase [Massilia psychrophila]PIL40304.1 arabinan endo-1,5-alpha-L-arabinosidase [Massilia psychrophila]GGE77492.1 extracellular endo-alpha-(1->5)-L-arabinanase 1 [Massilia psychrophila]
MSFSFRSLAAVLGLALCFGCQAAQVSVHDPVMAQDGARYYLFSTGPGITFYSSADMQNWTPEGRVFAGPPAWAKRAAPSFNDHIWAPDIQHHNGRFYLYYSVSGFGQNTSGIGVTVNRTLDPHSPDYRWEDQGMLLQSVPGRDDWNAIDPNIVEDGKGGAWMSFGSFWSGLKLVKLNDNWTQLAEPQEWHSIARRELSTSVAGAGAGAGEIEAPYIFRKNGYFYLFASWGLCCKGKDSTYRVMVGRASDVSGPYLDRAGKDMAAGGGSLVLAGDKDWQGVGHNSVYTMVGKDLLVLHAYERADKYLQKLKVMQIQWDKDGWPTVDPRDLNRYNSTQLP